MTTKRKAFTNWDDIPVIIDPALASVLLGRTPEGVTKMCREGKLPATKLGREWRIDRDRLRRMLTAEETA